jgi:hypothetical protein
MTPRQDIEVFPSKSLFFVPEALQATLPCKLSYGGELLHEKPNTTQATQPTYKLR